MMQWGVWVMRHRVTFGAQMLTRWDGIQMGLVSKIGRVPAGRQAEPACPPQGDPDPTPGWDPPTAELAVCRAARRSRTLGYIDKIKADQDSGIVIIRRKNDTDLTVWKMTLITRKLKAIQP